MTTIKKSSRFELIRFKIYILSLFLIPALFLYRGVYDFYHNSAVWGNYPCRHNCGDSDHIGGGLSEGISYVGIAILLLIPLFALLIFATNRKPISIKNILIDYYLALISIALFLFLQYIISSSINPW